MMAMDATFIILSNMVPTTYSATEFSHAPLLSTPCGGHLGPMMVTSKKDFKETNGYTKYPYYYIILII